MLAAPVGIGKILATRLVWRHSCRMNRCVQILGFFVFVTLTVAIVIFGFWHDVNHVRKSRNYGWKDCYGPAIPKELETIVSHEGAVAGVRASKNANDPDLQMIFAGDKSSVLLSGQDMRPVQSDISTKPRNHIGKYRLRSGFIKLNIPSDGVYRIASREERFNLNLYQSAQELDRLIVPVRAGAITCELRFVAEYSLHQGHYLVKVQSSAPNPKLIVAKAKTEMTMTSIPERYLEF